MNLFIPLELFSLMDSVDPWHFGTDLDPRIRIIDLRIRIRIRIRILLFSPVADKMLTTFSKFFCLLLFNGTFTSVLMDIKSKRSHKVVEIKVFLTSFCLLIEVSGSVQNNDWSGSGRPKKYGSGSTTLLSEKRCSSSDLADFLFFLAWRLSTVVLRYVNWSLIRILI
jgi:hypothetical protein